MSAQLNNKIEFSALHNALISVEIKSAVCSVRTNNTRKGEGNCVHTTSTSCVSDWRATFCNSSSSACDAGRPSRKSARLIIKPVSLKKANALVNEIHRHHKQVRGCKFCLCVINAETGAVAGVAIVGRPVSRHLDNGLTAEVLRVATDGTPNACSALLGACRRVAKAMGYESIITYTLESESGASLKAAGWNDEGVAGGGSWNSKSRARKGTAPTCPKRRWSVTINKASGLNIREV